MPPDPQRGFMTGAGASEIPGDMVRAAIPKRRMNGMGDRRERFVKSKIGARMIVLLKLLKNSEAISRNTAAALLCAGAYWRYSRGYQKADSYPGNSSGATWRPTDNRRICSKK